MLTEDERAANPYMAAFDVVADMENGYLIPDDAVHEIVDAALAAAALDALAPWSLDVLIEQLVDPELPGRDIAIARHDGEWYVDQRYVNMSEEWMTGVSGCGMDFESALRDAVAKAKGAGE